MVDQSGGVKYDQIGLTTFDIQSNSNTHFTGAIAANATGDENLTGLKSNKIRITEISIISQQNIDYDVLLWESNTFQVTADINRDALRTQELLNITTNGFQISAANQFYMTLEGLSIDYEDKDGTTQLHVSLRPRTAGGKAAGATGAVVLKFRYSVRS